MNAAYDSVSNKQSSKNKMQKNQNDHLGYF